MSSLLTRALCDGCGVPAATQANGGVLLRGLASLVWELIDPYRPRAEHQCLRALLDEVARAALRRHARFLLARGLASTYGGSIHPQRVDLVVTCVAALATLDVLECRRDGVALPPVRTAFAELHACATQWRLSQRVGGLAADVLAEVLDDEAEFCRRAGAGGGDRRRLRARAHRVLVEVDIACLSDPVGNPSDKGRVRVRVTAAGRSARMDQLSRRHHAILCDIVKHRLVNLGTKEGARQLAARFVRRMQGLGIDVHCPAGGGAGEIELRERVSIRQTNLPRDRVKDFRRFVDGSVGQMRRREL